MMTGGQEGDGEGRVGGVDGSGGTEGRVGGGEPLTLPTKAPSAPSTTTTTSNSNNNNNNSVNGTTTTSEAAILSPDSAIAVTPTTPSPPASTAAANDGSVEDREKNGRQDSLEKTRSEDTTSSEEGYEEDDEGDMEVEELSEEEEEEVVLSASMQFPLSKSDPLQSPQTPVASQEVPSSLPGSKTPQEEPNPTLEPQKAPQSQAIPQEVPSSISSTQTPQESLKSPPEPQKEAQEQSESTPESPSEAAVQNQKSPETEAGVEGAGGVVHLPDTVTRLDTPEGAAVYLVGTAHFSRESQEDVANTIRTVKPDVVVVELCKARTAILQLDEDTILQESRTLDLKKVQMILRQHGKFQGALYILLLSVSAHITKQLGMAPGGEFRTAFAEARRSVPGCLIQLGDRPIQVTLSRALASLSLWHKVKLTWHILTSKEPISKEEVEKCKQRDFILEMLAEMTGQFPAISEVFVKERDLYLCRSLQAAAHTPPGMPPRVVVGVVGIGHVPGIVERWGTVTDKDIAPIMRIPPPTLSSQIFKYSAKYTFYALLGYGAYRWLLPRSAQSALTSSISAALSSASSSAHTALQSVSSSSSSLFSSLLRK